MTNQEKFDQCWQQAQKIVAAHRSEAPEGCDPQNSGIALATLVIGAGSAYMANEQSKKSAEAGSQLLNSKFKPVKFPDMPGYVPVNIQKLQNKTLNYDNKAYQLSDADFKRRHSPLVQAEKLFEAQTLQDQQGESELMPAVQNEFMRAGIGNALDAFGDTPGTLAPGSAGEASVARNLGLNILDFQDRNRNNRQQSLITAEQLFPRRNFGLSGADAGAVYSGNVGGRNAWNQANYASKVQGLQFNATGGQNFANAQQAQLNTNATAQAMAEAERNKAILSSAEMLAKLASSQAGKQSATPKPTYATSTTAAAA